MTHKLMKTTLN